MGEELYCLHGLGLKFTTTSSAIASAARMLLGHFRRESFNGPVALELHVSEVHGRAEIPVAIPPSARRLFSGGGRAAGDLLRTEWKCDLYQDRDRLIVDFHEQGLLLIDGRRRRVEGYLVAPDAMHTSIRQSFLHFALAELLKREGFYTIHATALEKHGHGVLIPGASGKGKTTCCLALLRAGYRYLSDDHPLVCESGKGLELLSFPVKIDVTDRTIEFFPELRGAKQSLHQGLRKRYFFAEELYSRATVDSCKPALMIFPQVMDWPKSRLEPLTKSRALEELLPQGLLVFDKAIARQEFQTLSRLVERVDCYRLYSGEDVLQLPQLLDPLLDGRGAG